MKNRKWKVFATFCCTFVTNNADEWRVLARVYFMLTTEAFHVRRSRHEWPATSARTQTTAKGHDIPRAHHETHSAPRPLAVGSTRPRRRRRARRIGSSANQADPRRIPRRCPVRSSPARVPIVRRGDTRDRPQRVRGPAVVRIVRGAVHQDVRGVSRGGWQHRSGWSDLVPG